MKISKFCRKYKRRDREGFGNFKTRSSGSIIIKLMKKTRTVKGIKCD